MLPIFCIFVYKYSIYLIVQNKGVVVSRKWILNLPIRLNPIAHDRVATSLGNGLFVTTLSTHCWTVSYLYQSYDFPRQTQCKEVSLKGAQPQKGLIRMGSMDIVIRKTHHYLNCLICTVVVKTPINLIFLMSWISLNLTYIRDFSQFQ